MADKKLFDDKQLYREREVTARSKLSGQTLRNWRVRGQGPAYVRVGKRTIRYFGQTLNEFFGHEVKPFE